MLGGGVVMIVVEGVVNDSQLKSMVLNDNAIHYVYIYICVCRDVVFIQIIIGLDSQK